MSTDDLDALLLEADGGSTPSTDKPKKKRGRKKSSGSATPAPSIAIDDLDALLSEG